MMILPNVTSLYKENLTNEPSHEIEDNFDKEAIHAIITRSNYNSSHHIANPSFRRNRYCLPNHVNSLTKPVMEQNGLCDNHASIKMKRNEF